MHRLILMSALALAACSGAGTESAAAEGGATQRAYAATGFDKIDLSGSSDVIVRTGSAASVRAEGDAKALERLEIEVDGDTLRIGHKKNSRGFDFRKTGRTRVYVTVPTLTAAAIGGSGDMNIDKVEADRFDGSVAGSGNIKIAALHARSAALSIAGSGGIEAAGAADDLKLDIAGSGDLDLTGLQSKTASVSIAGSGNARANASESADISIMGSGNVRLGGTARCSVNKMGSGSAECGA
jgi:hypothetical protein